MTATTEAAATLTRAETAALLGGAGGILGGVGHFTGNATVTVAAIALLGIAALMGMSAGWFIGLTPTAPVSLVGARIGFGGSVFTVLDDSAPSVAAAQRGGGGRCSVMAVDVAGAVGLLFLCLDRAGRVTAAATEERDWDMAGAVG